MKRCSVAAPFRLDMAKDALVVREAAHSMHAGVPDMHACFL